MQAVVVKCALVGMLVASTLTLVACGDDAANGGKENGGAGSSAGDGAGEGGNSNAGNGNGSAGDGIGTGNGDAGGEAGTTAAADGGAGTDGAAGTDAVDVDAGVDAGSDASSGAPMGVTMEAEQSCVQRCDAQESVVGCMPMLTLTNCKTACSDLGDMTLSSCSDEYKAYYDCTVTDGFRCVLNVVAQKTTACADEKATFDACNGGS